MPSHRAILIICRVLFFCLGASCILSGFIVFAAFPITIILAAFTEIAGVGMLVCCVKADQYIDWNKIDAE